ncbi:MAG: DMT family protein [Chitinophagales bacterium]|nr:DMT family protein [Chitinophagales bacterium]MDW8420182.1 DMT family protein [Chitinophagales bacterium]
MRTVLLLFVSNIFMTFAWYGHLKFKNVPLWKAILVSWSIAFFEYCLMVPANRLGYLNGQFTASQLKVMQEGITLLVFIGFAVLYLREQIKWNYIVSFFFILCAVFFAFRRFD